MDIKINKALSDFYKLSEIFEDNIYIMTFAIKQFGNSKLRPNEIFTKLEVQNLNNLEDDVITLLAKPHYILKKFFDTFRNITHVEDYEVFKSFYLMYKKVDDRDKEIKHLKKIKCGLFGR